MKSYLTPEKNVYFNLHLGSRAQVLTCQFQVVLGAKENIPYFTLLNLQEVFKKLVCKTIKLPCIITKLLHVTNCIFLNAKANLTYLLLLKERMSSTSLLKNKLPLIKNETGTTEKYRKQIKVSKDKLT